MAGGIVAGMVPASDVFLPTPGEGEPMRSVSMLAVFILSASIMAIGANAFNPLMVINEVDYDQTSIDTAEFVELYNTSPTSLTLDGFRLDFINGADESVYHSVSLWGITVLSGDYLVLCGNEATVANCDLVLTPGGDSSLIQNGPDGIALFDMEEKIVDSMSYEGSIIAGITETEPAPSDDPTLIASLSRWPNGSDTDNNRFDFRLGLVTPGAANQVIPEPSAALLLGIGLAGIAAAGRRRAAR